MKARFMYIMYMFIETEQSRYKNITGYVYITEPRFTLSCTVAVKCYAFSNKKY